MKKLTIILFLAGLFFASHASAAYTYSRTITVTSTTSIASGTLSGFPMLVSSTLPEWKSTSTAGHVQNLCTAPNGGQEPCDLVFATSTANCGVSNLNFEVENYVSSTGALVAWVNLPTEQAGATTTVCYGNSSVTTDQSHPSSTWDANYKGVWHMPNGTTLNASDSTANANNGTIHSAGAGTGQIDGGMTSNGNRQYVNATTTVSGKAITYSAWVNLTSNTVNHYGSAIMTKSFWGEADGSGAVGLFYSTLSGATGAGYLNFNVTGDGTTDSDSKDPNPASSSVWLYVVGVYDGTHNILYRNGVNVNQVSQTANVTDNGQPLGIGDYNSNSSEANAGTNGKIDEVRISVGVARSASWILTEYNNEANPSTFYSIGSEVGPSTAVSIDACFFSSE